MESVKDIEHALACASADEVRALSKRLEGDERKGVKTALERALKRVERERAEGERLAALYRFERSIASERGAHVVAGIDEVGRGPLAGPLAVGAVILDPDAQPIDGLNDSKQLSPAKREEVAELVKERSLAWAVAYADASRIDEIGIAAALKGAFKEALDVVEKAVGKVDIALLDGNPMGFDAREVNVVKGDARCASIAAASVVAKVARDHLMDELDAIHPGYGFASNKGYGTREHMDALRTSGLSTVHRRSFCTGLFQESLF